MGGGGDWEVGYRGNGGYRGNEVGGIIGGNGEGEL